MIGNWDLYSGPSLALTDKVLNESLARETARDAHHAEQARPNLARRAGPVYDLFIKASSRLSGFGMAMLPTR